MVLYFQQSKRSVFEKVNENNKENKENKENKKEDNKKSEMILKEKNTENIEQKNFTDLYTIEANIKTSNGKFFIKKIVKAKDEKKAKILYEKEIKKEVGKIRSITKLQIKPFQEGDINSNLKIIEKKIDSYKETSLFEKALDILCNSSFIYLFKIPLPLKNGKGNSFFYEVCDTEENLKNKLKDSFCEAKNEIKKAFSRTNIIENKIKGEIEKDLSIDEKVYRKMICGIKKLSAQEIKNDKNIIKYIGKQEDEWYESIIKIHENKKYEHDNKISIVKENLQTIFNSKKFKIYIMQVEEIKNSHMLVIAKTKEQANQIAMCSKFMLDTLKQKYPEVEDGIRKININLKAFELTKSSLFKVLENNEILNDLISKNTFVTELICKKQFSLEIMEDFLEKVDIVNNTIK